eukprot:6836033-Prymnesium_polylepis.3
MSDLHAAGGLVWLRVSTHASTSATPPPLPPLHLCHPTTSATPPPLPPHHLCNAACVVSHALWVIPTPPLRDGTNLGPQGCSTHKVAHAPGVAPTRVGTQTCWHPHAQGRTDKRWNPQRWRPQRWNPQRWRPRSQPAVMRTLLDGGLIDGSVLTVTGKTLAEVGRRQPSPTTERASPQ